MDGNNSKYLKGQRSQSTSSQMGLSPMILNRDHRHRSSLPSALLAPSLYQLSVTTSLNNSHESTSSNSSPSPSSSIRDGLNRTSVISYSGTHQSTKLASCSPSSSSSKHQSSSPSSGLPSLQRPVSSSSIPCNFPVNDQLLLRQGPISSPFGGNFGRRHSVNTIAAEMSDCDVVMAESYKTRGSNQLSTVNGNNLAPVSGVTTRRSPSIDLSQLRSTQSTYNDDNLSQASLLLSLANSHHVYQSSIKSSASNCEDNLKRTNGNSNKNMGNQLQSTGGQSGKCNESENQNRESVISPSTSIESGMDSVMDEEMESPRTPSMIINGENNTNSNLGCSPFQYISSCGNRKKRGSMNESALGLPNFRPVNISIDQLPSRSLQDLRLTGKNKRRRKKEKRSSL